MRTLGLVGVVLAVAVAAAGCSNPGDPLPGQNGKACTDIGCIDQFHARVANADGSYVAGVHVLNVVIDDIWRSCTFPLPPDTVGGGGIASPVCSDGLQVFTHPLTECTTTSNATTSSQICTPIAGTIQEEITVNGTPSSLWIRQTVDGVVVLNRSLSPTYQSSQPNGPGCEPICRQFSTEWTFAAP